MTRRGVIAMVVLVASGLLAPFAMAVEGCGAMGPMCDGLCATSSCTIGAAAGEIGPADVSSLSAPAGHERLANTFGGLEHPPRLCRSA